MAEARTTITTLSLNRCNAIKAAVASPAANQSTFPGVGRQTFQANQNARFAMMPTAAAVMADKADERRGWRRNAST